MSQEIVEATFKPHFLHSPNRIWPQSNCYVDLWIELLHGLKFDPVPALAFTVGLNYEGDQFTFFKFPTSHLETLYNLYVLELSIYDNLERHVALQVLRGHIVLVEVDGFYLPDTAGVSYQLQHTKTTIGVNFIDTKAKKLGYYHNDIYGWLEGNDYDKIIGMKDKFEGQLFPYTEFVKQHNHEQTTNNLRDLKKISRGLLISQLTQKSGRSSPIIEFRDVFLGHIQELTMEKFHEYAFNNFRMLGSNFELLGSYIEWLFPNKEPKVVAACNDLATFAKTLQFKVARMVSKKKFDPCKEIFDEMEISYNFIMEQLTIHALDTKFLIQE